MQVAEVVIVLLPELEVKFAQLLIPAFDDEVFYAGFGFLHGIYLEHKWLDEINALFRCGLEFRPDKMAVFYFYLLFL